MYRIFAIFHISGLAQTALSGFRLPSVVHRGKAANIV
jgi:hypothetical protein